MADDKKVAPLKKEYSFDVTTPLGVETVKGVLYVTQPPSGSYTEGKLSGVVSQSYRFDVPVPGEVCSPEIGTSPLLAKICLKPDFAAKRLQGGIRTKNFPRGDWSDCTWVDLGGW